MIKAFIKSLSVFSFLSCILVSCAENDPYSLECTYSIPPIKINFNIVSKNGTDLFFSPDAPFHSDSLQIYQLRGIDLPYPVSIEGEDHKYFSFNAHGTDRDTCYFRISEADIDTLIYVSSPDLPSECPGMKLDTVYYNGLVSSPNQETGIFKLIKSP
ncbi:MULTISPECIES: hypothetical protein [Sphingobacteriaceae]|uniref:Lipoprotein n=1 Tax=Sphingobacterium sp. (strain 21) TaxID=743722 RepID=F4C2N0_SPHS2